jgi:uncharacterized SAM-binding protein YcdF (DUF218 family)
VGGAHFGYAATAERAVIRLLPKTVVWLVVCFGIWIAGFIWFIEQIPTSPPPPDVRVDAIVVLTGSSGRLEYGLQLLAEGRGKALFISGAGTHTTKGDVLNQVSPGLRQTLYAMEKIPLFLGHEARNTIGNAEETKRWIEKNHYKSVLLVTASYHLPRSINEFREVMPALKVIPAPVLSEEFNGSGWWLNTGSRTLLFSEYHKYLASEFRHWFVAVART